MIESLIEEERHREKKQKRETESKKEIQTKILRVWHENVRQKKICSERERVHVYTILCLSVCKCV